MKARQIFACGFFAVTLALALAACPDASEDPFFPAPPGPHEHSWGAWVVTTPAATCKSEGVETRTCAADPLHTETRGITGQHNWNEWAAVASEGMERRTCRTDPAHEQTGVTGIGRFLFEAIGHPAASYRVRKGTATAGEVQLPACYRPNTASEYLPVTEIGDSAFSGCTGLASVTFAAGSQLASIGGNAFSGCTSLTSVTFAAGSQLASIGGNAFYGCTSLTSVTFAAGSQLASIGGNAFSGCTSLASIDIPAGVTSIGNNAFSGCTSLASITVDANNPSYASENGILYNKAKTTLIKAPQGITGAVTLPAGVWYIDNSAFSGCTSLTSVTFAAGSRLNIGNYAFSGCSSLADIDISAAWNRIGDYAFSGCSSLADIDISEDVYGIGDYAFSWCSSLADIDISAGVTSIGEGAFRNCASLASVDIPASVRGIPDYAFSYCSSLASVTIPAGVTSIGFLAFYECTSLASITADAANTVYASQDGILYNKAKTTLIQIPRGISGNVSIPSGVTYIGGFSGCASLASIEIPASVTAIGERAFSGCTSLASIDIPASVTSIGNNAFSECTSLASITVDANNPNYASQDGILYNKAKTAFEHIPQALSGNVTIPASVTSIGDRAFTNRTSLTSIDIPAGVTSIGDRAFYGCTSLASVTFAAGSQLAGIGGYEAFYECTSLASIDIPAGVTYIGMFAFYGCTSLASVTFSAGSQLAIIYSEAFRGCTSLASITIPASVTSCHDAFRGWTPSQTINIEGHASRAAVDAAWGGYYWRSNCNATINYLGQ